MKYVCDLHESCDRYSDHYCLTEEKFFYCSRRGKLVKTIKYEENKGFDPKEILSKVYPDVMD